MSKTTLTRETWNDLRYPVSLRQLSEAEGGGWYASIPPMARICSAFYGVVNFCK